MGYFLYFSENVVYNTLSTYNSLGVVRRHLLAPTSLYKNTVPELSELLCLQNNNEKSTTFLAPGLSYAIGLDFRGRSGRVASKEPSWE